MTSARALRGFIRFAAIAAVSGAALVGSTVVLRRYRHWVSGSTRFHIGRVCVEGNDLVPEKEILALARIPERSSIWKNDLRRIEKRIETHPFIRNAVVARRFPDAVRIRVVEKKPVALVQVSGSLFCLDSEGGLLPAKPGKLYDLPCVDAGTAPPVRIGQILGTERIRRSLDWLCFVLEKRPSLYPEISEISFSKTDGYVATTSRKGVPVRLGFGCDERKLRVLEAFLQEWVRNPELSHVESVDLRFEGQVVLRMGA
jgi:cell division protein FtsQ